MSQYSAIKAATNAYIKTNGRQEITGAILNAVMIATIDSLGKFYQFVGVAVPSTDPGTIDQNIAYLASTPGTYTKLGGLSVDAGEIAVLKFDGQWKKEVGIIIPSKVSQLENDLGFITNAVSDLVNYYTKGETFSRGEISSILLNYYDKDEVDSIVSSLTRQSYVVAWDGTAEPVVGDIPAGVSVTWGGNPYVGTLPASASTIGRIYLVSNGAGYDEYITTEDGGYSWISIGTTSIDLSDYATKAELSQLEAELNTLASTRYYGIFASSSLLPADASEKGYAYVGASAPLSIYEVDYNSESEQWEWTDTGVTIDSVQGEPGIGFESAETPAIPDGTFIITLTNGDTITVDMNHNHPNYFDKLVGSSIPSGGLVPDTAYKLGTLTGTVTITLASAVTGCLNHYYFTFDTSSTAPTITFPVSVTKWDGNCVTSNAPVISASKHYEVSILDGVGFIYES